MRYCSQLRSWKPNIALGTTEFRRLRQLCWTALFIVLGFWGVPATGQSYAYVPTHKSNSISVINISSNSVIAVVPVGVQPLQAAISPDGAVAYVTDSAWFDPINDVSVISTATNSVVATIPVGRFPVGLAFTPNGAFAYVANQNSNNVSVINTAAQAVVATINVGVNPWGVAVTPNGSFAYVTNQVTNNVSVIDTATNSVVATVPASLRTARSSTQRIILPTAFQ